MQKIRQIPGSRRWSRFVDIAGALVDPVGKKTAHRIARSCRPHEDARREHGRILDIDVVLADEEARQPAQIEPKCPRVAENTIVTGSMRRSDCATVRQRGPLLRRRGQLRQHLRRNAGVFPRIVAKIRVPDERPHEADAPEHCKAPRQPTRGIMATMSKALRLPRGVRTWVNLRETATLTRHPVAHRAGGWDGAGLTQTDEYARRDE